MEMFGQPSPHQTPAKQTSKPATSKTDFLTHLELYLSKRDGLDKLLKISRYASMIILSSSLLKPSNPLTESLLSFSSCVALSRKAFRLGKFIQSINSFRTSHFCSRKELILYVLAYGGEGLYYFVEQFVWVAKSGLISENWGDNLQGLSGLFELVGYVGSVCLKVEELKEIRVDEKCLVSSIEVAELREIGCREEMERLRKVRDEKFMKRVSILQDLADGLIALADIRGGRGWLSWPLVVSMAGLLSALISTHRNWVSC